MRFVTPSEIESVAWEGELVAPAVAMRPKGARAVVAALGHPEIWPAARALEAEVGRKWTPPLGGADFWLLRLACTLREPAGRPALVERRAAPLSPAPQPGGERGRGLRLQPLSRAAGRRGQGRVERQAGAGVEIRQRRGRQPGRNRRDGRVAQGLPRHPGLRRGPAGTLVGVQSPPRPPAGRLPVRLRRGRRPGRRRRRPRLGRADRHRRDAGSACCAWACPRKPAPI